MKQQLVVVGNGMAGVSCVEQILKQPHEFDITIFGDETHVNYNRILLSLVLAGEKSADEIVLNDIEWYRQNNISARLGVKIVDIDRERKVVIDQSGGATEYDKRILATGSSAFLPFGIGTNTGGDDDEIGLQPPFAPSRCSPSWFVFPRERSKSRKPRSTPGWRALW